ncbi:MAG: hypothetical protein HY830_11070, partial [Actinobacteria bacterium]|nr:hypothetical protein [Actinomycetota bacterium]
MTDAAGLLTAAAAQVLAADGAAVAQDPAGWRDTAIRHAAATAWRAGDGEAVRALASGYGALLCLEPVLDGGAGAVALTRVGIAERRRRGAFGTPAA